LTTPVSPGTFVMCWPGVGCAVEEAPVTDPSSAPAIRQWSEDEVCTIVLAAVADLAPAQDGPIEPGARLVEDLGYHSLALLELAFALEDEFDLEQIDEATARKVTTVQAVLDLVLERLRDAEALS
jgi:acyl carrier protein